MGPFGRASSTQGESVIWALAWFLSMTRALQCSAIHSSCGTWNEGRGGPSAFIAFVVQIPFSPAKHLTGACAEAILLSLAGLARKERG